MTSDDLTREVIADVYCFDNNSNGEKCVLLDAHVNYPRCIYGYRMCGAWSLVHEVPFTLQKHVKITSSDKTRYCFANKAVPGETARNFFFAKKMSLLPDQQMLINVPIQSTKCSKEEMFNLYVDSKVCIGGVYCPTCKNEKCVYISTNLVSTTVRSAQPAVRCLILLSRNKSQHWPNLVEMVHNVLKKRTSLDYGKSCLILKNFLSQWQSTATEAEPKKDEITPYMAWTCWGPICWEN